MTTKQLKTTFMAIAVMFMIIAPVQRLFAESESYLDSIYQAVDEKNQGESGDSIALAGEEEGGVVIDTDDPNATVTVGDNPVTDTATNTESTTETNTETASSTETTTATATETETDKTQEDESLKQVNLVLADMTRILIGMNLGVNIDTSSFTLIDLGGTTPTTDTSTSSTTETTTSTDTATGEETQTSTSTTTETSTETNTDPETTTDTSTDTTPSTDPGLNTETETQTTTDTGSETSTESTTETQTTTETGSETTTTTNTETTTETSTETSTNTGSEVNTDTQIVIDTSTLIDTDTQTTSSVDTETQTQTETEIDPKLALQAEIEQKYGIKAVDGDSAYTEKQLELTEQALSRLPADFTKFTTEIIRDKSIPEDAQVSYDKDKILGYVVMTNDPSKQDEIQKVHILDRSTKITAEEIAEYEKANGPISDDRFQDFLESRYQRNIIHEMTHCYQNMNKEITDQWKAKFWPNGKISGNSVTPYGASMDIEDMAECISFYVMGGTFKTNANGDQYFSCDGFLRADMDMERYNFIKDNIFNGKEYRHTGHNTSDSFEI